MKFLNIKHIDNICSGFTWKLRNVPHDIISDSFTVPRYFTFLEIKQISNINLIPTYKYSHYHTHFSDNLSFLQMTPELLWMIGNTSSIKFKKIKFVLNIWYDRIRWKLTFLAQLTLKERLKIYCPCFNENFFYFECGSKLWITIFWLLLYSR